MKNVPLALCALVVIHGTASAAVVTFSTNQTFSQGTGQADLSETAIPIGGAGQFFVDPGGSNLYFDFRFDTGSFSTVTSQAINDGFSTYYFLESFSAGDVVGGGTINLDSSAGAADDWDTILVDGLTEGPWGATHEGYLGFVADGGEYGYIDYDFTRAGGVSTLTFNDGAYESVAGDSITIPGNPIPEPASTLGLGGLLCMSLMFRRK